jgi:protein TonB
VKRFLLAAVLALTLHGFFFAFGPKLLSKTSPAKPQHLTVTFALKPKPEAGPGPELEHPVPSPDEVVTASEQEGEPPVVRQEPPKETPRPPEKVVSPREKAPTSRPKADVGAKKKEVKIPQKASQPEKKKKISVPRPVDDQITKTSRSTPEARSQPVVPSRAELLNTSGDSNREIPDPLPHVPALAADGGPEAGEKVASIQASKEIRKATPAYRKNPRPEYPNIAKRRGHEGTVLLEVLVNSAGNVDDLRVLKSSGYQVLDRSAMKSVKDWLFEPGSIGDRKVDMWVRIPVRFELKRH